MTNEKTITKEQVQQVAEEHPEFIQKAEEAIQGVLVESATDLDFREKLLDTPREALADFAGESPSEVPEALLNLTFVESEADVENEDETVVQLPEYQGSNGELSENELETVSGGGIVSSALLTLAVASTVAAGSHAADNPDDVSSGWNDAMKD